MTPKDASAYAKEICGLAPVIPVIVVDDLAYSVPLAEALVAGGLPVLEVTLRTPVALDVIKAMAEVPGGVVGAGTLLGPKDVKAAKAAGAKFGVSPGVTEELLAACEEEELPLLAGTATISEAMRLLARGYDVAKFFPAEVNGGAPALKAFYGPLPQMNYCPTGGVSPDNAVSYLSLPNVMCVGGSWVVTKALMSGGEWGEIESLARAASRLGR
ncbi:bifunctional 4-hydroxy-2-oxoglutarate aldolase/2-dehydro-3-deoxy-phosphogluconate aldolase [Amaricoccus sp.]|uniref:bifunctional 4-hydroxy-2-oxoglutarate aldolase/2-dehydro-3-deoxy-phosphogluconate aldolase n=1 Tax=Amaricoccus sp. TaxID=1872485 RepID=UPI00261A8FA2|nr:bifunctional 4-hydroxy-2-oxoglutarate aldolase/2-dehydro-3-deoxy-phosphogluconate aldolase [uncultured Amaricoccus sp.]